MNCKPVQCARLPVPCPPSIVLALLIFWLASHPGHTAAQGPPEGGGPPVALISVETVAESPIRESVMLTGTVEPKRFSTLTMDASGLVEEMFVDDGELVAQGQEMLRLRSTRTELALAAAEADLAIQQAQLQELLNGTRPEDLAAARAAVEEAEARLALAESEEARASELLASRTASKAEFDNARAEFLRAKAALARATADLDRAVNGPRAETIDRQRAEVASAEAEVARLRDELTRYVLRAPFDGVIGQKQTEVGQWVSPGAPLFAIAELDVLRVRVALPERYFNDVRPGDEALVTFDALGGDSISAPVAIKVPLASQAARTFPVMLEFPNAGYRVAPGMFARVEMPVGERDPQPVVAVPKDAVVREPGGATKVWLVRDFGDGPGAFPENVVLGRSYRGLVEITSGGVADGDRIVVRGNETILFPSQPVEIVNGDGSRETGGPAGDGARAEVAP